MKIKAFKIPQIRFLPLEKYAKYRYSLGGFSYGEYLIFRKNEPVYYLYILDEKYKEFEDYISFNGGIEVIIPKIGQANNIQLSCSPRLFGIDNYSKEEIIEIDIPEFPLQFWENYKNQAHIPK